MGILTTKLYSIMVSNGPIKELSYYKATLLGNELDWESHMCEVFATTSAILTYIQKSEIKSLIVASYLAYIPYGSIGYKAAKEIFKEMNVSLTLEEFRFEKFKIIMGDNLKDFSSEQVKYIKEFFLDFEKEILDITDIRHLAILFCRIHNEIEANYDTISKEKIKEMKTNFSLFIKHELENISVVEIDKYLSQINKPDTLNKNQIAYIKQFLD